MNFRKKPSIFIGYLDTCGYFDSVHSGFLELGCKSCTLFLDGHNPGHDGSDGLPMIARLFAFVYKKNVSPQNNNQSWLSKLAIRISIHLSRALFLIWQIFRFDVFIYKSGETLYESGLDIKIFRLLKKRVVFFFVGSDSRPDYLIGSPLEVDELEQVRSNVIKKNDRLKKIEPLADIVIANPLSSQLHNGDICVAQIIGNTINHEKMKPGLSRQNIADASSDVINICHAPSAPELKGSDIIRAGVDALRQSGVKVNYIEITNRPHCEVMEVLASCDIVIDELYSDSYGGMLALEACAFGKPVIVCGYGAEELSRLVPSDAVMPTLFGRPEKFEAMLFELAQNTELRKELGDRGRNYYENSRPEDVARRFLIAALGRAPDTWFVKSRDIQYMEGVAGRREVVSNNLNKYIKRFGVEALCLNTKPLLKDEALRFAEEMDDMLQT